MSTPSSDKSAIRQIIRTLRAAGYVLNYVNDGEERISVANEAEAIEAITAVDEAVLWVAHPERRESHVYFVLGNEPFEVAADYGVSLDETLQPLFDHWEA